MTIDELILPESVLCNAKARTSMAEDLRQGRKTEIDELQGEIIRLGEANGINTPGNIEVYEQIKERENPQS